jgi:hypothetical protein
MKEALEVNRDPNGSQPAVKHLLHGQNANGRGTKKSQLKFHYPELQYSSIRPMRNQSEVAVRNAAETCCCRGREQLDFL